MRGGVGTTLALAVLATPILPVDASAQSPVPPTVLTIHVGAVNFPTNPPLEAGIRETLKSRADQPLDYFAEYLDTDVSPEEEAFSLFDEYIHQKYRGRRIDLVITTTDDGLRFALDHRPKLFPDAPIIFSAVDVPDDTVRRQGAGAAGIRIGAAYTETLKLALTLHPSTEHVFVVSGVRSDSVQARFRDVAMGATLTFIDEPTVPRLLAAIQSIPSRSLLLYQYYAQAIPGQRLRADEVAPLVANASEVPVYGTSDMYMGSGVIGGVIRDTHESGARLGALALRVLAGTRAQDIPVEDTRVMPVLDWRAMERWRISESRLPPGSVIRFRGPSLWRDYRRQVLATVGALVVQSISIVALLYQRRARWHAEVESRRSLALAADSDRRATMTALTGSIAHELGQPLNAIMHNAQAAELLVASNRATPEKLHEILADIRTADVRASQIIERHRTMLRAHQIETKPIDIDAVVREGIALVAHETKSRQIQVDVAGQAATCFVVGDPVLLQQVVVNLVMNAIDAMTHTTAPGRRRITVQSTAVAGHVQVSFRDAGTGLPAGFDQKLFEPFVTTKARGMGIGLTIVRSIIEAHRGKIHASNNPEGGATFTIVLPCVHPPRSS